MFYKMETRFIFETVTAEVNALNHTMNISYEDFDILYQKTRTKTQIPVLCPQGHSRNYMVNQPKRISVPCQSCVLHKDKIARYNNIQALIQTNKWTSDLPSLDVFCSEYGRNSGFRFHVVCQNGHKKEISSAKYQTPLEKCSDCYKSNEGVVKKYEKLIQTINSYNYKTDVTLEEYKQLKSQNGDIKINISCPVGHIKLLNTRSPASVLQVNCQQCGYQQGDIDRYAKILAETKAFGYHIDFTLEEYLQFDEKFNITVLCKNDHAKKAQATHLESSLKHNCLACNQMEKEEKPIINKGELKTCTGCREEKQLEMFFKHSGNPDGFDRYCKICRNGYSKQNFQSKAQKKREEKEKKSKEKQLRQENEIRKDKVAEKVQEKTTQGNTETEKYNAEPTKMCSTCKEKFPLDDFAVRSARCRPCFNKSQTERRNKIKQEAGKKENPNNEKQECTVCLIEKPIEAFQKCPNGRMTQCKVCVEAKKVQTMQAI